MENIGPSKLNKFLKLDYSNNDNIWLSRGITLRRLVGISGVSLPVLLWFFLFVASGHLSPLYSISHYYFTRVCSIFVIIVSLLAIFLLIYKGKQPIDFYISSLAGIFSLCLLLFPTGNISEICGDTNKDYSVTVLQKSTWRENFHYISAAIFLLSLASMSLFLFTKSNKTAKERTPQKKIRNRIYITCGVIMILSVLVIFFGGFMEMIPPQYYDPYHITFWMETSAVESFGFAWLIKGEMFFKD